MEEQIFVPQWIRLCDSFAWLSLHKAAKLKFAKLQLGKHGSFCSAPFWGCNNAHLRSVVQQHRTEQPQSSVFQVVVSPGLELGMSWLRCSWVLPQPHSLRSQPQQTNCVHPTCPSHCQDVPQSQQGAARHLPAWDRASQTTKAS